MNNEKMEISVPVIATRGIIVFPQQDIMIEVGREKSIRAVEEAEEKFDGHVWLVCQKDIMVDNPAPSDSRCGLFLPDKLRPLPRCFPIIPQKVLMCASQCRTDHVCRAKGAEETCAL